MNTDNNLIIEQRSRTRSAWTCFFLMRLAAVAVDTGVMGGAYLLSFALRFDFREPSWGWRAVAFSFITVWAVQLIGLIVTGCYTLPRRRIRTMDFSRYLAAAGISGAVLTLIRYFLPALSSAAVRPPYSVTLIDTILFAAGIIGVRFLWRDWQLSRVTSVSQFLNREECYPDPSDAVTLLQGSCVMVTGAGGTVGSELVRQVAANGARQIILADRSENALYEIDREIRQSAPNVVCVPKMIDIADETRMRAILAAYRPSLILHAAAYKHVPMTEANPREGLYNNTFAAWRLGEWARDAGVARFVMISTDKAVHPVGVMAITKRLAEILLMDLNRTGGTRFSAVRFGNILGSSGSVVPLFREQIARHQPVTVTHPDMKRYFMTAREAACLVLQAAAFTKGGEIFVLDMGAPVRIIDLAEELIRAAGFRPYIDVPIRFTGIRPGEKLFEELDVSEKNVIKTTSARLYVRRAETGIPAQGVKELVDELLTDALDEAVIRDRLKTLFRFK